MEFGIKITGTTKQESFFEKNCNESCPRGKYLKGGCDCIPHKITVAEFKRDRIHESFIAMLKGVGM